MGGLSPPRRVRTTSTHACPWGSHCWMSISDIFSNTTRQGVLKDLICNRAFVRLLWCYCFCNAWSSVHFCRSNRHKCMEQKPNIHCYAPSLIEAIGTSARNRRSTRYKTSKQKRSTHHKRIKQKAVNKVPLWDQCCLNEKVSTPFNLNLGWILFHIRSKP